MNRIMIIQVSFLKLFLKSWDIFDNLLTNIDEIAYLSYIEAIMDIIYRF